MFARSALLRFSVLLGLTSLLVACSAGEKVSMPVGTTQPKLWCYENVATGKLESCLMESQAAEYYCSPRNRADLMTYDQCRSFHFGMAGLATTRTPYLVRCTQSDGTSMITDIRECKGTPQELPSR